MSTFKILFTLFVQKKKKEKRVNWKKNLGGDQILDDGRSYQEEEEDEEREIKEMLEFEKRKSGEGLGKKYI